MSLIFGIVGNVIWGFTFLMQRLAQQVATPEVMLSVRFILAIVLLSIPLMTGREKINLRGRNLKGFLVLGLLEPIYYYCESYGVYYTNSAFAGVTLAVVPVISIAMAMIFLKEYPSLRQAVFCLVSIAGVIIITISGNSLGVVQPIGIIFLVICGLSTACYKTLNRKISEEFSTYERTYITTLFCAIPFTLRAVASEGGPGAYIDATSDALAEPVFLWSVIGLSILGTIAAKIMVNYATKYQSVTVMTSLGSIITLCSLIAGIVILKEPYSPMLLVGAAMILVGVWQIIKYEK